ncbi:MAG: chromosomal replication initiator protein DnaA [Planctomycetota bacterium]
MDYQEQAASSAPDHARFSQCLDLIKQRTKGPVFETWFQKLELVALDDSVIRIGTLNQFVKQWIEEGELLPLLEKAVGEAYGRPLKAQLVVMPRPGSRSDETTASVTATPPSGATQTQTSFSDQTKTPSQGQRPPTRGRLEPDSIVQLKDEYVFETYVVGPSNRFAHAAALAVVKNPGRDYNPLFIHSNVGLGKTHLLQAICHELVNREPHPRILYLSCEEFVNRFVTALSNHALETFRAKHRSIDVLVIDDIHFLADKRQIQEEFFHTFNALYNAQKQIILSSDSHPSEIPTLEERLVSRFNSGLVAKIEPPPFETRAAIIKKKALSRGCDLGDDVVQLLAQRIDSNIREIEGALNRLIGTASLTNTRIDREFASQVLRDLLGDDGGSVPLHEIADAVCAKLKVKLTDLQSKRRTKKVAFARHIAMFVARQITEHTLAEIGSHFGGKDHTTVLYALEKIGAESERNPETRALIEELQREARARRAPR